MAITRYFTLDDVNSTDSLKKLKKLQDAFPNEIDTLVIERCYHVETHTPIAAGSSQEKLLCWLLKAPQVPLTSMLKSTGMIIPEPKPDKGCTELIVEIGPRFNFSTPFSTNCVSICHNAGLKQVTRLEVSQRHLIRFQVPVLANERLMAELVDLLSDRMTECHYTSENMPRQSFNEKLSSKATNWGHVPILLHGRLALQNFDRRMGLALTDQDLAYYTDLFRNVLSRDPTEVEIFDLAQSNSEHSRHWFFRGSIYIDDVYQPETLMQLIKSTQQHSNDNNTIKFSDNSSAIKGFTHTSVRPALAASPCAMSIEKINSDLIFTAETHNMPTAVAPFSGATTGTGGRLRDVQGVGRGGIPIAGTAGYCVGCLNIPGYEQPYENNIFEYPSSFAKPLQILIEASNGASDYGNKFGEPVISGFVMSYGILNAEGKRDEYVKPIMFSGGLGTMDATMRQKFDPEAGMLLAKIGGPVYRIGVGGGAASSVEVQGSSSAELDFNAVQRGDPEMENKLNRVVRACIEMGDKNPIVAIHDQGAGGNGNVLKELVEPSYAGAVIFTKDFQLGDPTISTLELWGAEYQENNAILCRPEDRDILERICERERCPISFVGFVTGNGRVTLLESSMQEWQQAGKSVEDLDEEQLGNVAFDLELRHVLGEMPQRTYYLDRLEQELQPLNIPLPLDLSTLLERVLSLVSVGSKRFLTNKVDRCVSGLIAQQQCVGPLHTPLADFGLAAVSHFDKEGIATSIGAQPIKGLLSAAAMARMCVAEAISNLVFVGISELADVKCSGNWMWAAKLAGEGAKLYTACKEMCQLMEQLHIAVDGGKDSLSMAAKVGKQTVVSPGTLVVSTYAPCPDISIKITPDLKGPLRGIETTLLWITIEQQYRLGGSALAQVLSQQGNECPTLEKARVLKNAFETTQELLKQGKLLAGHDISDGGLIVCLLEMAFAGLAGLQINLAEVLNQKFPVDEAANKIDEPVLALLFAEECGWVLEVDNQHLAAVQGAFNRKDVPNFVIGQTDSYGLHAKIEFKTKEKLLISNSVGTLYKQWERTSFELEKLQADIECATEEYRTLNYRTGPSYRCTVDLKAELQLKRVLSDVAVRVAVLREEGVNSDREMMACLLKAHFEVHDVAMSDLLSGTTNLDRYRGLVFPGGFSYADTLGSAKGWAGSIMLNEKLQAQFSAFKQRSDTFSLGICNGCQLMSLMGWFDVDAKKEETVQTIPDVALLHNNSGRFECRWSTVQVQNTPALMLQKLQGSVLGCWVAHGEGRFSFRTPAVLKALNENMCVALKYVDDKGLPTEVYPMNPNGSVEGIAGLCSIDGRHLALMPHPERCSDMFQWPYVSPSLEVNESVRASPWQLMFHSAYEWCVGDEI